MDEAEKVAKNYQKSSAKTVFILTSSIMPILRAKTVNKGLIELSKKTGIPLVATNDVHYLKPEDAEAQDILMLINTGSDPKDPERLSLKMDDFSMKAGTNGKRFQRFAGSY